MKEPMKVDRTPGRGRAPSPAYPDTLATRGELIAPTGKFRLVVCDTFDYSDFAIDFNDRNDAVAEAKARSGVMRPCYVYDSDGNLIFNAGQP